MIENRRRIDFSWLLLFGILLTVFSVWLTINNFNNEMALRDWVNVLGVLGADEFRLEHLGLNAPPIPLYMLMPFTWLPENSQGTAPYVLSSLLIALLLVVWNHQLRHNKIVLWQRVLLLTLMILQVPLLWAATTGENLALSLVVFYFVYRTCLRMNFDADLRSFVILGFLLAIMFFINAGALFIYIALFPFFVLIAPRRIVLTSPVSVYIVITIPLAVVVFAWAYLNWIFEGSATNFIHQTNSKFLGGWQNTPNSPWLMSYGGQWLAPLGAAFILLVTYFPIVFLLLGFLAKHKSHLKVSLSLLIVPLIAIAFASSKFYIERPVEMLALIMVGVMAELSVIQIHKGWKFLALVLLLFVGGISGWHNFLQTSDPVMRDWQQALLGELDSKDGADRALGQFLSRNRGEILIDDLTAYRAIAVRGDAEKMALPRSNQFKLQVRRKTPDIEYIVVPDPNVGQGGQDRINKHFPAMYAGGMQDYRRVYDYQGWRVFKHDIK